MAAADDEILRAPRQPDIALGVEPAEITGVEPAAGQHGTAVMARIEITRGDLRAAHQHVADRAGRAIAADRAVGRHVGDADRGVGQAQAGTCSNWTISACVRTFIDGFPPSSCSSGLGAFTCA
jgi:hypothetical protein